MAAGLVSYSLPGLGEMDMRPIRIDDLSSVRYVHSASLRSEGAAYYTAEELGAFESLVRSVRYAETVLKDSLIGGWVGQELIGTAGWGFVDDSGTTARIASVFVRPLFTGLGVGRGLVAAAEELAWRAGYYSFSVRATINAVPFFEQLGYEVTSHGTRPLSPDIALAVSFMRKDYRAEMLSHHLN